jgi:hypothetical protein
VEVIGRSSVAPTEAIQRAVALALQVEIPAMAVVPALQVEIPMVAVAASSLQDDQDTAIWADTRSLNPKAARILQEAMAATWEVHRLQEILPTTSRGPIYS